MQGFHKRLQITTMQVSFGWLVAANLIGLLLALLLNWPQLGNLLGELSYGRWMPLHMEWHLYGWCSIPLVGLLLKVFLQADRAGLMDGKFALLIWSLGLLAGGLTYLSGHASGKLFLSWTGWVRAFFPITLCLVWSVLATHWFRQWSHGEKQQLAWVLKGILLLVLASVPFTLFYASSRSIYPPVNPQSGGATGHSLLASSLGIIGMFGLVPYILGLKRKKSFWFPGFWSALAIAALVYVSIHHGNAANTERGQIIGLGTLIAIIPFLAGYFLQWNWPAGTRPWIFAFLGWWSVLTLSGWITFLPGVLDQLKFTNGMVAHAHMAMAGMITSFNFLLLASLGGQANPESKACFGGRIPFVIWNTACALMVAILLIQGWREGASPGVVFGGNLLTVMNYHIRTLTGILMLGASLFWLISSLRLSQTEAE